MENSRLAKLIALLFLIPLILSQMDIRASANAPYISVSNPYVPPGVSGTQFSSRTLPVEVDVTTTVPLVNVTLYYMDLPYNDTSPMDLNLSDYHNREFMYPPSGSANGTWYRGIPPQENYSRVVVIVVAYDQDNLSSSPEWMDPLYYVLSPPGNISLTLQLSMTDVNSSSLFLNTRIQASLYNTVNQSINYMPQWFSNYGILPYFTGDGYINWAAGPGSFMIFPESGDMNLFPFDSYNYSITISFPNVNFTSVYFMNSTSTYNLFKMEPNTYYENCSLPLGTNFTQASHLSDWQYNTRMIYIPYSNSSRISEIRFMIQLTGRSPSNFDPLVFPVFAIVALLGGSLILRRDEDLLARITIYITVPVASLALSTQVHSLAVFPMTIGPTMIDRLLSAIIPLTATIAVATMFGAQFPRVKSLFDFFGVLGAVVLLYFLTSYQEINEATGKLGPITSIFSIENWTFYFLLAIIYGLGISLTILLTQRFRVILNRRRNRPDSSRKDGENHEQSPPQLPSPGFPPKDSRPNYFG